jgi:nitroreductase
MSQMCEHSSVRSYTAEPVDQTLLKDIIRCGQAASSSSFIQACSVIRVTDSAQREMIAQAAGNQRYVVNAAEFLVLCADMSRIEYCCEKSAMGEIEGYTEHFLQATVDTALMAQNMLLAAESAGLGGVFIGGIRNEIQTVTDCLGLPEYVYPAFGLCLGWPADKQPVKPRLPVDVVLHENTYQRASVPQQVDAYDVQMAEYYAARQSNAKTTDWSQQTANAVQGKKREHMLAFLQQQGFLKR